MYLNFADSCEGQANIGLTLYHQPNPPGSSELQLIKSTVQQALDSDNLISGKYGNFSVEMDGGMVKALFESEFLDTRGTLLY